MVDRFRQSINYCLCLKTTDNNGEAAFASKQLITMEKLPLRSDVKTDDNGSPREQQPKTTNNNGNQRLNQR